MFMLQVKDLGKEYSIGPNKVTALQGINLAVEQGEYIAVMGPSGSGKSTFMNILGCLDRPTQGHYWLAGKDVGARNDDELAIIRNQYIGFIFQSFNLLPRLNALENVALPLIYRGLPAGERIRRAREALEAVGLHERIHHLPSELSGGQQQRVAIARALAGNPLLILADEPTGNLDSRSGAEVMNIFSKLNGEGITIILVTHDEQIARQTKRVIRFKDGIMQSDERTGQPNPLHTQLSGGVVNL